MILRLPRTRSLTVIGSASMILLLAAGCSTGTQSRATQSSREVYTKDIKGLSAMDQLGILAEREALKPSTPQRQLLNRIMDGKLVELRPGTEEYTRAHTSLEDVLRRIASETPISDAPETLMNPQIAKGYVRARTAMLEDDTEQAITILSQLVNASPDSMSLWVGLGDAYLHSGDRVKAAEAYLKAVDLGERSMRSLVYSAMGSQSEPDTVTQLSAMAWTQHESSDISGRLLAGVMLGQALLEEGSLAAGAQVMGEAMALLDGQTARDPRYRRELVQLYTQRAEQYASLGDAWLLLDLPDRAMMMYDRSAQLITGHPQELMVRRVAAHMLAGHSAAGALELLDWIDANPGSDTQSSQRFVSLVGEHPLIGDLLVDSITQRVMDRSRPESNRQAELGMLLSLTANAQDAADLLAQVDPAIVSPVACARVMSGFDTRQSKIDASMGMINRSPSIGTIVVPAMIRLDGHPLDLLNAIQDDSETAELIRALIALDLQRPDLLGAHASTFGGSNDLSQHSTSWLIAMARVSALSMRWTQADQLLATIRLREADMNNADLFFYVDTLVSMNRPSEALSIIERRTSGPQTTAADLLIYSRIANLVGQPERALEALTKAVDMDPYSESIYEQLITLRGPAGALPDNDELRTITRSLSQRLPDSALIALLRAHELAGASNNAEGNTAQGIALLQQSERQILEAHQQHPWRQIGIDLLLSLWATEASQGDPNAIQRGLAWLDQQSTLMPGSVELAGAKARLMVLSNDEIGAEGFLDAFFERMPSRAVGRLHEGLIRSDEDRRAESDAIALARLDGLVSVGDCLERLERAVGTGTLTDYDADLLVPIKGDWMLGPSQSLRIVRSLGIAAQSSTDPQLNDLLLELTRRARAKTVPVDQPLEGTIDPLVAFNQIELVVRPSSSVFTMDQYAAFVRDLLEAAPANQDLLTMAIQSTMRSEGQSAALDLFTRLSINSDGSIAPQRAVDLVSLMGQVGTSADVELMLARIDHAGLLVQMRDAVIDSLQTLQEDSRAAPDKPDSVRADLVYTIGVVASFYDREEAAHSMHRLALRYDPDHAWANNDLGYQLAERGEQLDEAESLLIRAHTAVPNAANITDSLAWVRYALGIFDDERDADGQITRSGAKSLLLDAITLEDDNPTMHDHLGDTLWMLSDFDGAMKAWLRAEELMRSRLTELSNQTVNNPRAVESIRDDLSTLRFKISDAESGRIPKVGKNSAGISVPANHTITD